MDNLDIQENLKIILDEHSDLSANEIRRLLNKMSSSEIAHALESSPPKQRQLLFSLLNIDEEGDVLSDLGEEIQQDLVSNISNDELAEAVKELDGIKAEIREEYGDITVNLADGTYEEAKQEETKTLEVAE